MYTEFGCIAEVAFSLAVMDDLLCLLGLIAKREALAPVLGMGLALLRIYLSTRRV